MKIILAAITLLAFPLRATGSAAECAADMAKIKSHVYDTPEWNNHLVIDANNEYVWNGDLGDLAKFALICDVYDGDTFYGDLVHDYETIPAGERNYKHVPFCVADDCLEAEAIEELVIFAEAQFDDCPLVASFESFE